MTARFMTFFVYMLRTGWRWLSASALLAGLVLLLGWNYPPPGMIHAGPSQTPPLLESTDLTVHQQWSDSILSEMTLDEKIGQLFMVPVYTNKPLSHRKEIEQLIKNYHIGGIIFMQGGPVRQVNWGNYLQSKSKVPLLVAQDAEWGLGMRLDSTHTFPRQLLMGAIKDPSLIEMFGREVGRQCKRVGVHVNFAPVVDINNNPDNPVINDRSFGENRYNVALRGLKYIQGMQELGVMACAKHYPGHGDTDKDSHKALPVINHDRARLDSIELFPFRLLAYQGVMSMMTAHLYVPAIDPAQNKATSLSKKAVNDILLDEYGFKGLVFTDALNMQGAIGYAEAGQMELDAFLAGNDILLFPQDIPKAKAAIKDAIEDGTITVGELNKRVRKILNAKDWVGLDEYEPLSNKNVYEDLHSPKVESIHRQLVAASMTMAANDGNLVPFKMIDTLSIATVRIGGTEDKAFQQSFAKYYTPATFEIDKDASGSERRKLIDQLDTFEVVVASVHDMSRWSSKSFGVTKQTVDFLEDLQKKTRVVVCLFGSPYSLVHFEEMRYILVANENTEFSQNVAAQVLFGGIPAQGQLPVSASAKFRYGMGEETAKIRLSYGQPEDVGLLSPDFKELDLVAKEAVTKRATPGCQVFVAKDGHVIYEKYFGHHTYEDNQPVGFYSLYDLASITKIAGSTLALMDLYEARQLDLDRTLSDYMPALRQSNLADLKLREVLTHTAGLKPWIPFYAQTVVDMHWSDAYYCYEPDEIFCIKVADSLYMRKDYVDSMISIIASTDLNSPGQYKYSDLGFYIMKRIIEGMTLRPLDEYLTDGYYRPLGLRFMRYKPLQNFPSEQIVPTEYDQVFRDQVIHGHVHDPGAAMLGGVSGHAGLFSNANDLGVLMQMLLNGGRYGGERFLLESTIEYFTKRQHSRSRRGLGFDKPEPDPDKGTPTADSASLESFGHTGFTGTCTWVDPKYNLVYVFLSNRVYPTAENKKLVQLDIRTRIQQAVYDAIRNGTIHGEKAFMQYNE